MSHMKLFLLFLSMLLVWLLPACAGEPSNPPAQPGTPTFVPTLPPSVSPTPTPTKTPTETPTPAPTRTPSPEPTAITARELYALKADNPANWDLNMLGNRVWVSGRIATITRGDSDDYAIYLLAGATGRIGNFVSCRIPKYKAATIVELSQGDQITVVGTVSEGEIGYSHIVFLKPCTIKN